MIRMTRTTKENLEAIGGFRLELCGIGFSPVFRILLANRCHHHGDGAVKGGKRFFLRRRLFVGELAITVAHVARFGDTCAYVVVQIAGHMENQVSDAVAIGIWLAPKLFAGKRIRPLVEMLGDVFVVGRQTCGHSFVYCRHGRGPLCGHPGSYLKELRRRQVYSLSRNATIACTAEKSRIPFAAWRPATQFAILNGYPTSKTWVVQEIEESKVSAVPTIRIRECNDAPVRAGGDCVLYWMIANRRVTYNFALDRALEHCRELGGKPLVILEALRCDYRWASDRFHRFVLDGMADNARACAKRGIVYYPYIEPKPGAGKGLLEAFAAKACIVVTDDYPSFFLLRMVAAAAKKLSVRLEAIDSNGLLPLRAAEPVFARAFDFRRYLQRALPAYLLDSPSADPLAKLDMPQAPAPSKNILSRWPAASAALLEGAAGSLDELPIDHGVAPAQLRGGHTAACQRVKQFLDEKLETYDKDRNEPDLDGASGLSPYLHFGHISAHEVFAGVMRREKWNPKKLALRTSGSREGWWHMSAAAEAYLDQLITWREVGYNFSARRGDADRFESLPDWAQKTLEKHAKDEREYVYSLKQFETAKTYDPLWNAAQRQLVREGRIHNYLRMLWGKKILEWSRSAQEAARIMIHLNDKYALDGRDPNSYSGIFWVLGRYDRPWGPERPIFGLIRYMSSENTARKLSVKKYLQKYGEEAP